jgi:sentrin-specific protease 7
VESILTENNFLRYLTLSVLSEEDQSRTHVFSSFFYKRLTTRPAKSLRRSHPVEDDPKLSPAEKRHSRVKSWTKNINIFEKDFIIIPINEQ